MKGEIKILIWLFLFLGERKVKEDKPMASSLEANISPLRESPVNMYGGESLMNAVENKTTVASTNPFDEYDKEKNPFFEDEGSDDDGYDKSLNPFAS